MPASKRTSMGRIQGKIKKAGLRAYRSFRGIKRSYFGPSRKEINDFVTKILRERTSKIMVALRGKERLHQNAKDEIIDGVSDQLWPEIDKKFEDFSFNSAAKSALDAFVVKKSDRAEVLKLLRRIFDRRKEIPSSKHISTDPVINGRADEIRKLCGFTNGNQLIALTIKNTTKIRRIVNDSYFNG